MKAVQEIEAGWEMSEPDSDGTKQEQAKTPPGTTTATDVMKLDAMIHICESRAASRIEEQHSALNPMKILLSQGIEFAVVIRNCITRGYYVAAMANLRMLLERSLCAKSLLFNEGFRWERESMSRKQSLIERQLQRESLPREDREYFRITLEKLRYWNRDEDTDKGRKLDRPSRRGRSDYEVNSGEEEVWDLASTYVHPSYEGATRQERDPEAVSSVLRNASVFLLDLLIYQELARASTEDALTTEP